MVGIKSYAYLSCDQNEDKIKKFIDLMALEDVICLSWRSYGFGIKVYVSEYSSDWSSFNDLISFLYRIKDLVKDFEIELWCDFFHDGQCNMQFDLSELEMISELKATLCVSCYYKWPFP